MMTRLYSIHIVCDYTLIVSPGDSAIITPDGVNVTVRNETYTLTCSAEGGPGNEFTWKKLDVDNNEVLSENSDLILDGINGSYGGIYQCTVENMAGNSSADATVNGELNTNIVYIPPLY